MEEKHHLFFWFPFLGSLPSLLTSLPPPLLYIFMFLNPFLSSLCPHLTFPLLTSPHILHPLLFFPSFHLCLISPCLPAFPFLNFFQFFTFSHFSCFLFPFFFISFLTSTPFHSSFDHIYLNLHLPAVLIVPFLLSPAHLFLFFSFLLFSFFFFITLSYFALPFVTFQQFFFCFCSHPFLFNFFLPPLLPCHLCSSSLSCLYLFFPSHSLPLIILSFFSIPFPTFPFNCHSFYFF